MYFLLFIKKVALVGESLIDIIFDIYNKLRHSSVKSLNPKSNLVYICWAQNLRNSAALTRKLRIKATVNNDSIKTLFENEFTIICLLYCPILTKNPVFWMILKSCMASPWCILLFPFFYSVLWKKEKKSSVVVYKLHRMRACRHF